MVNLNLNLRKAFLIADYSTFTDSTWLNAYLNEQLTSSFK